MGLQDGLINIDENLQTCIDMVDVQIQQSEDFENSEDFKKDDSIEFDKWKSDKKDLEEALKLIQKVCRKLE